MKRLLLLAMAVSLLIFSQFALAGDVEDLKAAHGQLLKAFMSRDAAAIASMICPGAVNFESAFPMLAPEQDTVAQLTNHYTTSLGFVEYLYIVPYNTQYKVVGNTGISWGHATVYEKVKGEKAQARYERLTLTWVKSGGKWLVLMAHTSPLPSAQ